MIKLDFRISIQILFYILFDSSSSQYPIHICLLNGELCQSQRLFNYDIRRFTGRSSYGISGKQERPPFIINVSMFYLIKPCLIG